jgi:glycosyltransferase involved in cell wall biosynthesis
VPRVTVVIATYNWCEVLPYSIGSVLDQTFTDFELMVVGDGCTDGSADVVEAIDDPRLSWLNLPVNTRHQSGPNNEAIRRSGSELIAYVGHDDLWLPHHLAVLVDALTDEVGIGHGSSLQVRPGDPPTALPCGDWTYSHGCWLPPTSLVHSRSLADRVGGWRPPWETGPIESETDLLARMIDASGRLPIWVRDVTSVKLPASWRPDVYRTRPCHEQAAWLERIRSGETWRDLIDPTTDEPVVDPPGRTRRAVYWTRRTLGRQSWRRPLHPHRGPIDTAPVPDTPRSAERRWREQREFKGLEPFD